MRWNGSAAKLATLKTMPCHGLKNQHENSEVLSELVRPRKYFADPLLIAVDDSAARTKRTETLES